MRRPITFAEDGPMLEKIITSGQSGADQARRWPPCASGWRPAAGPPPGGRRRTARVPWLAGFGLVECPIGRGHLTSRSRLLQFGEGDDS